MIVRMRRSYLLSAPVAAVVTAGCIGMLPSDRPTSAQASRWPAGGTKPRSGCTSSRAPIGPRGPTL
jgi:hypothetical protein